MSTRAITDAISLVELARRKPRVATEADSSQSQVKAQRQPKPKRKARKKAAAATGQSEGATAPKATKAAAKKAKARQAKPRKAKGQPASMLTSEPSAKPVRKQRAQKKKRAAQSAPDAPSIHWESDPALASAVGPAQGFITRSVHAAVASSSAAMRMGLGFWTAAMTLVCVLVFSSMSWDRAPAAATVNGIRFANAVEVPSILQRQWLQTFPQLAALRHEPSRAALAAFGRHLIAQPSVATVNRVQLAWAGTPGQDDARRLIEVDLVMRAPRLPVMLPNGERSWVDDTGVVISGTLAGPKGLPVVRGYERGGIAAMQEVLEFWPLLQDQLEPGLITEILLDAPLGSGSQQGIVLLTRPGAVLVWGAPGESSYGVSVQEKVANLVHTVQCQGDLSAVASINVRFTDPFEVPR